MPFYEKTLIARQDLSDKDLKDLKTKYNDLIKNSFGNVLKIEEWGLINLATKIKRYKKAFFLHFKFEGNDKTLTEIKKKIRVDGDIIRHLMVKYKKLDLNTEFFKKK